MRKMLLLTLLMPIMLAAQNQKLEGTKYYLAGSENATLFVVDGIPVEQADLSNFDPNQIESIDILKETISGIISCRVARPVVLIRLKKDARHVLRLFSKEDSAGVRDALVIIKKKGSDENGVVRFSNEEGFVNLEGLDKGSEYEFGINGFTYQSQTVSIKLEPGLITKVQLEKKALELQEVMVVANMTGYSCHLLRCGLGGVRIVNHPNPEAVDIPATTANLYPNPVVPGRELNVTLDAEENKIVKMEVHNLSGQILFQQKVDLKAGAQQFRVPVQHSWAKGVYILSIKTEKDFLLRERFLVQ